MKQRFVICPSHLINTPDGHIVILTDINYWHKHSKELDYWCTEHNSIQEGMTVLLPDDLALTMFTLRWS